jgi:hypothetical protein
MGRNVMLNVAGYDFLDFGTGAGGCYDFAKQRLHGQSGLGFEFLPHRVTALKNKGYECVLADITKLSLPKKSVKFVTISHVLEHLPSLTDVTKVIALAINTATDFVFIEGPTFDFDTYLKKCDLKFFWVGWSNHPSPVTTSFIKKVCIANKVYGYDLLVEQPPIQSSLSTDIVPLESTIGNAYRLDLHGPKPLVNFDKLLFRSFVYFIWVTKAARCSELLLSRKKFKVHTSSPKQGEK